VTVAIIDIVSIRTQSGAEKLGEQSDEEDTETRHTGADYADVDFDSRPLGNGQVIPCWVARLCEMEKGLKT
jgi:hypothetical protein